MEFIYKPRGFSNVYEMNNAIIKNWNDIVQPDDDVYVLGDLMLGNNDEGIANIKKLKGKIHVILGNHDTDTRKALYEKCYNVIEVTYSTIVKYNGYNFYLSHYPTITSNLEKKFGRHCLLSLYGHTHQQTNFYNDMPFCYHVGVDSHNCTPVSIEQVIEDIKNEVEKCKKYL